MNLSPEQIEKINLEAFHHGMSPVKNRAAFVQSSKDKSNRDSELNSMTEGDSQLAGIRGHRTKYSLQIVDEDSPTSGAILGQDQSERGSIKHSEKIKQYMKKITSKNMLERFEALHDINLMHKPFL